MHFRRSHMLGVINTRYWAAHKRRLEIPDHNFFGACDKGDGNIFKVPTALLGFLQCGSKISRSTSGLRRGPSKVTRLRNALKQSPYRTETSTAIDSEQA